MSHDRLSKEDIQQIVKQGMTEEAILAQIDMFKRGISFTNLCRPCTASDGIVVIQEDEFKKYSQIYTEAASSGRIMKFTPASGAASRMFESLLSAFENSKYFDERQTYWEFEKSSSEKKDVQTFIKNIKRYAFYEELESIMFQSGLDIERLITDGQYSEILEHLLTPKGLNYANLPKALLKFHRYPDQKGMCSLSRSTQKFPNASPSLKCTLSFSA